MGGIKLKERDLDIINSPEQRKHIIEKHLLNQSLRIKGDPNRETITIQKYVDSGEKIVAGLSDEIHFSENDEIVLYKILAKYVQLECSFIRKTRPGVAEFVVTKVSIAKSNRAFPRYSVAEDAAHVTNINSSKTVIDASLFNIPTLVKVSFEDYKTKLKPDQLGLVEIDVFKSDQDEKFELIKRTKNTSILKTLLWKNPIKLSLKTKWMWKTKFTKKFLL
ncbi:PF07614 family protein [Leptospira kirschneri str. 200801925]|nr:PF07614 family protein [Leptospira kirschneri str. 200801925]